MKFLVDAQLPARLCRLFEDEGHYALHTSALPGGNASTDAEVAAAADQQARVVVTKDRDFRDGHLLTGSPRKLLVVATGNISNDALLRIFEAHLDRVVSGLTDADFVELGPDHLAVHARRDSPGPLDV